MRVTSVFGRTAFYAAGIKHNKSKHGAEQAAGSSPLSFKGIYMDDKVSIGDYIGHSKFEYSDALLLNEISSRYPNQDCFIRPGLGGSPRLEFRERPYDIPLFTAEGRDEYTLSVRNKDEEYPCIPLLIYGNSPRTYYIGRPSRTTLNPSLAYTIKAGFELHKKILDFKYKILDGPGVNDEVHFGGIPVQEKARILSYETEDAVTRHLLEAAKAAVTDPISSKKLYESLIPRVQSRLSKKRKLDLVTPAAKQPVIDISQLKEERIDLCENAMIMYPDRKENIEAVKQLDEYIEKRNVRL